jgi:hypothetical protein
MSDSSNCETCKFWSRQDDVDDRSGSFMVPDWIPGSPMPETWEAAKIEWGTEWGTCERQSAPGSPMFTNDASEFFSALRTKPTHYCSAWEQR